MQRATLLCLALVPLVLGQQTTLYGHFTAGGISEGIRADNRQHFVLNGKPLTIFGGSLHYFRVHPDYWRDRLRKFRAAGLNTIDIYIPWNLHEPERDVFDFGDGGGEFSHFLNVTRFLEMVKEEDMFAVFRPGPYICSEWDFGGLPSWLMSEHPMHVRTSFEAYQDRSAKYLHEVVSRVKDLQFYTESGQIGGPIILTQIENEYGSFGYTDWPRDKEHLRFLRDTLVAEGIETALFTSDSPSYSSDHGNVEGAFMTANFKHGSIDNMERLLELQPDKPIFITEYWPGWFDHWFEDHNVLSVEAFSEILGNIFAYNGSVNFYMFHGGTHFGFMNGANVQDTFPFYEADVTSYDYDAPLTEAGHYTPKYERAVEMIAAYDPLADSLVKPDRPEIVPPVAYNDVQMTEFVAYNDFIAQVPAALIVQSETLLSMEQLPINNNNGQSYGYIVYRKELNLKQGSRIVIRGHVRDLLMLIINGKMVNQPITHSDHLEYFGAWGPIDSEFVVDLTDVPIPDGQTEPCEPSCTVDFMVENMGRANFGRPHEFDQKKGLWEGPVVVDGQIVSGWTIIPLEFRSAWVQSLTDWQPYNRDDHLDFSPRVLRGSLTIDSAPSDTYFDYNCTQLCTDWLRGFVYVNGFNIGRFYQAGPQKTLYVPAPMLVEGVNEFIVMENYRGSDVFKFTSEPYYGVPVES